MTLFLWIKVLHVLAVISWMAGMLYLPRLFVYHSVQERGDPSSEMLKTMELRLLKYIMNPAMIVTWLTGAWMAYSAGYWQEMWFLLKFVSVLALSGVHGMLAGEQRRFGEDGPRHSQTYYRVVNEIPTLLMIFIVCFVILKPF